MSVEIDHAALREATTHLETAGADFGKTGRSAPAQPDAGLASGVLADILHSFSNSGARLVTSTTALAETADRCNTTSEEADREAAEALLARKADAS